MLQRSIITKNKVAKGVLKLFSSNQSQRMKKIIFLLFAVLLFFVPLILWPFTSEVFEFNKMVLVYILTTLITGIWVIRMISEKKIIFRRTILDIPLLVFLGSQIISTVLSVDPLTSLLGYYSRFNGGLLSTVCYSLLYWAFISNINAKRALKLIYITLISAALVSIYGVLEHFGVDKNVWVQDVQSRVFSTLGQPNWLAAWVVALLPITWALTLNTKIQSKITKLIWPALSALFYIILLFTKSRSGFLGFVAADILFWIGYFWFIFRKNLKKFLLSFGVYHLVFIVLSLIIGTEFTPSVYQLVTRKASTPQTTVNQGPALEVGGTESSTIREIVWKGALQVWLHYPVFGTGVETFAYSYYLYRPVEHNLTSEWDYIYNKAHNEYLNFAANSGTVGLISYSVLIGFVILSFVKPKQKRLLNLDSELSIVGFALLAGYISLLVTNFFGFSVVPTQLEFFLFPAIALVMADNKEEKEKNAKEKLNNTQKTFLLIAAGCILIVVYGVVKYWYADYLYATGKAYNSSSKPDVATKYLTQAIELEPNQALYYGELANSYTNIALAFNQQKNNDQVIQFSNLAISESDKAISLSPANVNLKRSRFGIYIMLSVINPNYLTDARDTLISAITQAPTDAKLYYNLGLTYARIGQADQAINTLKKTIELKANYKEARLAYAILLIGKKQNQAAKDQLNYILQNIDPNDSLTKQTLESIK